MITIRNLFLILVSTAVILPLTGCGEKFPDGMPPPVPCEIIVMQDGNPLEGAVVRLQPIGDSSWDAVGRTDASGKAVVYTMDQYKGAVAGKYKVIVSKTETEESKGVVSSEEALGRDTSLASFYLVEEQFGMASTTTLEIEAVKGTPTHTVDVGKAVRIKIDDRR